MLIRSVKFRLSIEVGEWESVRGEGKREREEILGLANRREALSVRRARRRARGLVQREEEWTVEEDLAAEVTEPKRVPEQQ